MATNKNQHFVPRCYLKAFTQDGANLAINLFNLDRKRCIPGAPVKNQCAGDYFYGQDALLERAIQTVETGYAAALKRIQAPGYRLQDLDRAILRKFILFQHMRTEAASRRSVEMFEGMGTVIDPEMEDFSPSIKEAVLLAMKNYAEIMHVLGDLKICLLLNKTPVPFITSDDPAVMTNRWHIEDSRVQFKSPGLVSCGAIFFLPLSPRLMCVAYDGDVHSIPHEGGWADVRSERDVIAFNEHQFLNAFANVYFQHWDHGDWITSNYNVVEKSRLPSRHRVNYAVLDKVDKGHKVYRAVKPEEAGEHTEALIHTEVLTPRPLTWPSLLKWRSKGAVYTNGTGAGYVRAAQTSYRGLDGYWRESARR